MPYSPTTWIEGITKLGPTRMNAIEQGIAAAIPADIVDAKGDLILGTAADTVGRLAAGADNEVPIYSSGQATGMKKSKIADANVSDTAGILQSKLAFDAWAAWSPAWTATGTAPALGDGTLVGRFVVIGKTVFFTILLTSGASTTYGTGDYRFSLPVTALSTAQINGVAYSVNAGVARYGAQPLLLTTTTVEMINNVHPGTRVGQLVPFTFAVADQISVAGQYEAA